MTGGPLKPVQVIPPGLMGLLQLKQTGRLPDALLDEYRGVIELRDWIFQARRLDEVALFGSVPLATGITGPVTQAFVPNVVVPSNQTWYVDQLHIALSTVAAADRYRFTAVIISPSLGSIMSVAPDVSDVASATLVRTAFAKADRGFWMNPGESIRIFVIDAASAGMTASCRLRATPLPI